MSPAKRPPTDARRGAVPLPPSEPAGPLPVTHDETVSALIGRRDELIPSVVGGWFAQSFEKGFVRWRSSLSYLALVRHLDVHELTSTAPSLFCEVCGIAAKRSAPQRRMHSEFLVRASGKYSLGSVASAFEPLLLLDADPLLNLPSDEHWATINAILDIARSAPAETTAADLCGLLRGAFKGNRADYQGVVSSLGDAGILVARDHPSPFERFITARETNARSMHRQEISYPVQHWKGADGVNEHAVEFWLPGAVR